MNYKKLEEKLKSYNKYEDDVIYGIIQHLKDNPGARTLRLRVNGIDGIINNDSTFEEIQQIFKNWNAEFIDLKDYEE